MRDLPWHPSAYLCICLSSQNSKERLPGEQEGPRYGGVVGSQYSAVDLLARERVRCWHRLLFPREGEAWAWEAGCRVASGGPKTCVHGELRTLALLTRSRSPTGQMRAK